MPFKTIWRLVLISLRFYVKVYLIKLQAPGKMSLHVENVCLLTFEAFF